MDSALLNMISASSPIEARKRKSTAKALSSLAMSRNGSRMYDPSAGWVNSQSISSDKAGLLALGSFQIYQLFSQSSVVQSRNSLLSMSSISYLACLSRIS